MDEEFPNPEEEFEMMYADELSMMQEMEEGIFTLSFKLTSWFHKNNNIIEIFSWTSLEHLFCYFCISGFPDEPVVRNPAPPTVRRSLNFCDSSSTQISDVISSTPASSGMEKVGLGFWVWCGIKDMLS